MNEMMRLITKVHRCEDCPIRCQAARRTGSIFYRIHRWHKTWWPGWQIYQEEQRGRRANTTSSASN